MPQVSYTTSARSTFQSLNRSFSCCHVVLQGRLWTTTCTQHSTAHGTQHTAGAARARAGAAGYSRVDQPTSGRLHVAVGAVTAAA